MTKSFLHRALAAVYFNRTELEKALLLSCLFSIALTAFRVVYTGQTLFLWLGWNLFLALVPCLLTQASLQRPQWIENNTRCATGSTGA